MTRSKTVILLAAVTVLGAIGGLSLAAAVGGSSARVPTTRVGHTLSGNCDEPEHFSDPECAGPQRPEDDLEAVDDDPTTPDPTPSSSASPDDDPDDISGPCDEAEHANDPRCTGTGDDDRSGPSSDDDDRSGPSGDDEDDDDRSGPSDDDDDDDDEEEDDDDRSGSNSGRG